MKYKVFDVTDTLVTSKEVRKWCLLPYPDHPKGCPNYNKSALCPPKIPMVDKIFDLSKAHYFVVVKFDLATHAASMKIEMKKKGKDWSDRQCRCVLYWQRPVKKRLAYLCHNFVLNKPDMDISSCWYSLIPEAMGIDVFATCRKCGLVLQRNPQDVVYKIALVGTITKKGEELLL